MSTPDGYVLAPFSAAIDTMLVGRARSKEVKFSALSAADRALFKVAMAEEWQRWQDFKAFLPMTKREYDEALGWKPRPEMIGARWVLTWKPGPDRTMKKRVAKARLVAQGCQECNRDYRTDSPTASRTGFYLTLLAAVQTSWRLESYDARTAFLQSGEM